MTADLYWTRERVIQGMQAAAGEIGYFPERYRDYERHRAGNPDWPPARVIWKLGRTLDDGRNASPNNAARATWRKAMALAGIEVSGMRFALWTEKDDQFLLDNAGRLTLKEIAKELGRSWEACKRRLSQKGVRARDAQGFWTMSQLAQAHNIPLSRIKTGLRTGRLRGTRLGATSARDAEIRHMKESGLRAKEIAFEMGVSLRTVFRVLEGDGDGATTGFYWQIDPESVEENIAWLTRPKVTHTSTPPSTADYYKRHGLKRNGKGQIIGRREVAA